jgi:hypothetical protein
MKIHDRMIITAASSAFGPSLLALLGSLNLNWPSHPRIRVYDIGLDDNTLRVLDANDVEVIKVPEFCAHWRKHFTWKIWCWNDAPAREILWMDAGLVVLKPIDEAFDALGKIGYFTVPTYHLLSENASEGACRGCGVDPDFRNSRMTLAATLIGFKKHGQILDILQEALAVALTEEYIASTEKMHRHDQAIISLLIYKYFGEVVMSIASTEKMHRHDQAIISLLIYKYFGEVVMSDGIVYCGWLSPGQTPGQKVWVHRREILPKDQAHLARYISIPGQPYMLAPPKRTSHFRDVWKKVFGAPERLIRRALRGELGNEDKPYEGIRDKT